ncbi:hypothetical protein ASPCAL05155 [Aspergillus calidoustus]|uniref:Leucine-rich repeat domain-containing protein n=1 Tax=Aspergillus calidoustus TaxID=454130 RepID=A0A0U4Z2V0_ASPCI|nr:hypothetical protein ASPCAL05155 [Aspergillus calidoustus]
MLTDLPNEILLLISRNLPDTSDVLHFASCSRDLQELLLSQAYSCVTLRPDCIATLSRLTTVLSHKPSLAARVRHLHLASTEPCSHKCRARYSPNRVHQILNNLALTEEELTEWKDALVGKGDREWDQEDAWWAMLWTLLPNLEKLDIAWENGTDYRERVLERIGATGNRFNLGSTFTKLREVNLKWWRTEVGISTEEVLLFFRLPALERFSGYYVIERYGDDEDTDEEVTEGVSTVTDIQLHSSNSSTGFASLSRAVAGLKSIVYHHAFVCDCERPLMAPEFHQSLSRHKSTLESISMAGDPGYGLGTPVFFGPLLDFTALRQLSIPSMCLLDWEEGVPSPRNHLFDVLPPSLESLSVEAFHDCVNKQVLAQQLGDVVKAAPGRYPSMTDLILVGHFCDMSKPRAKIGPDDEPPLNPKIMRIAAKLGFDCITMSPIDFGIFDSVYGWISAENFCPCCMSGHSWHPDDLDDFEDDEDESDDDDDDDDGDEDDDDDDEEPTSESDGETSNDDAGEISPNEEI